MSRHDLETPELVPILSRGKHRNPRKGACFMELASYLAGERWSDHPACTHPLLAGLARLVNDFTSDAARPRLAPLIPSVIGLTSDDLRVDARIALRAATVALPVAAAERQRVLAVSVLVAERVLADIEERSGRGPSDDSQTVLAEVPLAAEWARNFARSVRASHKGFRRYAAPSTVRHAVVGIAEACIPDSDELLHDLLVAAIDDCAAIIRTDIEPRTVDEASWSSLCELTGVTARR